VLDLQKVSFIHAADIHLGSMVHFTGSPPNYLEEKINEAVFNSWNNLVELAILKQVDFILLAGDIFDREQRSIKAADIFYQGINKLAKENIKIFMIAGNHDHLQDYQSILSMPDNFYLFSAEKFESKLLMFKDFTVKIIGRSYASREETRNNLKDLQTEFANFSIVMLHTDLAGQGSPYLPLNKKEILTLSNVDYWALGHRHLPQLIDKKPTIAYPGVLQARDFGELGKGGCWLVELIDKEINKIEFKNLASLEFKKIIIKLTDESDLETFSDLIDILQKRIERLYLQADHNSIYLLEMILKGQHPISKLLSEQGSEGLQFIKDELNNQLSQAQLSVWIERIVDQCINEFPISKLEELKDNNPLYQELESLLVKLLADKELKNELLQEMGEIWTTRTNLEESNPLQFEVDDDQLQYMIEQSKRYILNNLFSGGK